MPTLDDEEYSNTVEVVSPRKRANKGLRKTIGSSKEVDVGVTEKEVASKSRERRARMEKIVNLILFNFFKFIDHFWTAYH